MDKIGLLDLDGTLANYEFALRRDLELLRTPEEPEITDLWNAEKLDHIRNRMRLIKNQVGWWKALPVIQSGYQVYELAKNIGFECEILTKGPSKISQAWKEKVEWVQKHISDDMTIHITLKKSRTYGSFLFDDFPEYMDSWLEHRPRGVGIMPVNNCNKDYKHPRVLKYDGNLQEVSRLLQRIYDRKAGESVVVNEN